MPGTAPPGWLYCAEYALTTAVTPSPDAPVSGGRLLQEIRGRGAVRAPSAFGRGLGWVQVRGRGAGRVAAPVGQGRGSLQVAGRGVGLAQRATLRGHAYAANPGEWVVVIEAEGGEDVDVIHTR